MNLHERTTKNNSAQRVRHRSGSFLVVTILGLVGIVCSGWIAYIGAHKQVHILPILFVAAGFVFAWWLALACRKEIRALQDGGALDEIQSGTPVNTALELTLRTINNVLFYCFVTMLALLVFIGFLLKGCP
jgi:hypothetical protein